MTVESRMPGFTVTEAAYQLGVTRDSIYRWEREGRIQLETNSVGQKVVPYGEVYRILKEREGRND